MFCLLANKTGLLINISQLVYYRLLNIHKVNEYRQQKNIRGNYIQLYFKIVSLISKSPAEARTEELYTLKKLLQCFFVLLSISKKIYNHTLTIEEYFLYILIQRENGNYIINQLRISNSNYSAIKNDIILQTVKQFFLSSTQASNILF